MDELQLPHEDPERWWAIALEIAERMCARMRISDGGRFESPASYANAALYRLVRASSNGKAYLFDGQPERTKAYLTKTIRRLVIDDIRRSSMKTEPTFILDRIALSRTPSNGDDDNMQLELEGEAGWLLRAKEGLSFYTDHIDVKTAASLFLCTRKDRLRKSLERGRGKRSRFAGQRRQVLSLTEAAQFICAADHWVVSRRLALRRELIKHFRASEKDFDIAASLAIIGACVSYDSRERQTPADATSVLIGLSHMVAVSDMLSDVPKQHGFWRLVPEFFIPLWSIAVSRGGVDLPTSATQVRLLEKYGGHDALQTRYVSRLKKLILMGKE